MQRAAPLTPEQRAIVDLDVSARTIVISGPGTGKTHTLIYRAAAIVDRDVAAAEVLIVSFTNAVVGELRLRLAELSESDAEYVRPTTIDGLAARIVARQGGDPGELGFDKTVLQASAAIDDDPEATGVDQYRHIIVDEAQDLVGSRLTFIDALLRASDAGFTVLGDPAQGIYGFSERGSGVRRTGIEALSDAFPDAPVVTLTHDHRSQRPGAAPGHSLRSLVLNSQDYDGAYREVLASIRNTDRLTVDQLVTVLKHSDDTTGVLCRNNGEALYLSGVLADASVPHKVRRAATDRSPPSWVARLFGDVDAVDVSRSLFDRLAAHMSEEWRAGAWKAVRRLAGNRSGTVSLQRLRENLRRLDPEEAPDEIEHVPVLSTVHRSKGLQYDTAIILEPCGLNDGEASREEIRVLYVAMTRARHQTLRLERPVVPGKLVRRAGRWLMISWRGGTSRIEVRVGDVDEALGQFPVSAVRAAQTYLADEVVPGDPIELHLTDNEGVYSVEHGDTRIGFTSAAFRPFASRRPRTITGLRIDCVRAAAGDPSLTRNLGIGDGGLWLVPEVVGLGQLLWKEPPR